MHKQGRWVLTHKLRVSLYAALFTPKAVHTQFRELWNAEMAEREVNVIRGVQAFLLEALTCWETLVHTPPDRMPNLECFVVDALLLLNLLQAPRKSLSESYHETHPFFQLNLRRSNSWLQRWTGCVPEDSVSQSYSMPQSDAVWEDYMCGLCDALFGMWPAAGHSLFHTGTTSYKSSKESLERGCVRNILSFDISTPRSAMAASHAFDIRLLDAGFIENNGPFRFEATDRVELHLTITKHTILYYSDWKKWAFLTRSRLLRRAHELNDGGEHAAFDTLANKGRIRLGATEPHFAQPLICLSQDILVINILCFYQSILFRKTQKRSWRERFLWFLPTMVSRLFHRVTSITIARRINVQLSEPEARKEANLILGTHLEDWGGLLDTCGPFWERILKVNATLKDWKPSTVWEMRYSGYGGVDPVGRYAFYFAIIFGLITMFGLGVTVAQTFASFKAIEFRS
jgi:hypothetical protein